MAIFSFSNGDSEEYPPRGARPAFLVMGFAVLFGGVALALPEALFAPLTSEAGAPFDLGARGLAALAAAGVGAMAGAGAARLVARGRAGEGEADRLDGPVIRPLNARDELGGLLDWPEPVEADASDAELPAAPDLAPGPVAPDPPAVLAGASLRDSSLAELVERLRAAMERRRARMAAPVRPERFGPELEPASPEVAARAKAEFFSSPADPAFLRAVPDAVDARSAADDTDSALRASLARLRQLRGAA